VKIRAAITVEKNFFMKKRIDSCQKYLTANYCVIFYTKGEIR
jgi:hypothetical protein